MRYISLFSGIGGFEFGIQKAYVETINRKKNRGGKEAAKKGSRKRHEEPESFDAERGRSGKYHNGVRDGQEPPTCVGYSEIDRHAIKIYEKHFPKHKNFGDIKKINARLLPRFDLLVAGFPCQSFSIAGKRKGFDDTRGTLFFDIARIVRIKRPRLLLLENVKGLLSHEQGRTFATILRTLDDLGYDLQWQVLNSKHFGVPQNRERVYIVGHLRGTPRPEIFFVEADDQGHRKQHVPKQEASRGVRNMSDLKNRWRHSMRIRRLTPVECERLQSFPDGWTEGISETQRYKTLGNAVTSNVVKAIAKKLLTARVK